MYFGAIFHNSFSQIKQLCLHYSKRANGNLLACYVCREDIILGSAWTSAKGLGVRPDIFSAMTLQIYAYDEITYEGFSEHVSQRKEKKSLSFRIFPIKLMQLWIQIKQILNITLNAGEQQTCWLAVNCPRCCL